MTRHRNIAAAVFYLIAYVVFDVIATRYSGSAGFSPWYLGGALDLALFATTSWRMFPLVGIALVLRGFIFGYDPLLPPVDLLIFGVAVGLGYAGCFLLATRVFDLSLTLGRVRDVLLFFVFFVVLAPLLTSLYSTPFISWLGIIPWQQVPEQFFTHAAGDAIGIAAFLPAFLVQAYPRWRKPVSPVPTLWLAAGRIEFLLAMVTLVVSMLFVYWYAALLKTTPHFAPAFIPLAWLAVRFGLRGAAWGMLTTDTIATALSVLFPSTFEGHVLSQTVLIFVALVIFVVGTLSDSQLRLIKRLETLALTDGLTGLPNRAAIELHLGAISEGPVTLALIDIDNTRLFNESLGRSSTDALLTAFGTRALAAFGATAYVGRFSADEFAIIFAEHIDEIATRRKIDALFSLSFATSEAPLFLSGTVGIASCDAITDIGEFIMKSDAALERAKQHAPEPVAVRTGDQSSDRMTVRELHRALDAHEFVMYYQPIFRIDGNGRHTLDGAEALLRWEHPQRGLLRPARFFDVLERLAIAEQVGWWALERALRDISALRARFGPLRSWVNLSARQVRDPEIFSRVCRALALTGVQAEGLVLEMNERILANDDDVVRSVTSELREIGVGVAIDDFGTGGSSYGRVRDVPANILKIDRSFVARADLDEKSRSVAAGISRLGLDLGMELVAEGVENQSQLSTMLSLGCTFIQGYELGHPMPIAALEQLAVLD